MVFRSQKPAAPRVIGQRWEIQQPLADGGMATVYVAKHVQTGRRAALKVLTKSDPETLARFKLEASISAELRHPGIVDVLDAGLDPASGDCYIAMELLEGRTLRTVMDDPSATPLQVIGFLTMALEPLAVAHERGYVHRDLKPENVFVVEEPDHLPRVKLLDFGIAAQDTNMRMTRTGMVMGTPHYMSPEQATNARNAGPAADVWSVGVMIYEAIASDVPFKGETSHGVVLKACTKDHDPVDTIAEGVDFALARLVDKCLAKEASDRPANARMLLDALCQTMRPNSVPAARPNRPRSDPAKYASGMRERSEMNEPAIQLPSTAVHSANALTWSGVALSTASVAVAIASQDVANVALAFLGVGGLLSLIGVRQARTRASLQPRAPEPVAARTVPIAAKPETVQHPSRGPYDARVELELYADLSDAVTRRVCQRVMSLRQEHPTDIQIKYIPFVQPERETSWLVATIGRHIFENCGPDGFWTYFDLLLSCQRKLSPRLLEEFAATSGAHMHELRRALRAGVHQRTVAACRERAVGRGVTESPALFMNGIPLWEDLTDDRMRWAYYDALKEMERAELGHLAGRATEVAPGNDANARMGLQRLLIRYRGARNATVAVRRTREQAEERAHKLLARARMPGADFGDLALRFGDALEDLRDVSLLDLPGPLANVAAQLQIGELGRPVHCEEGLVVLRRIA